MMQRVWSWSSNPLLIAVSILLGVVTIKCVYCLCFEKEINERIAWRQRWFLLSIFWRLAGFVFSQECGCAYARPSGAVHI